MKGVNKNEKTDRKLFVAEPAAVRLHRRGTAEA
jgi:hypothetical protein